MSAQAVPVTTSVAVRAKRGAYHGFSLRETVGGTAVVRIFDNPSAASGTLLDVISLGPGESAREFYAEGIEAVTGIFYSLVSGTVEGSIRSANL